MAAAGPSPGGSRPTRAQRNAAAGALATILLAGCGGASPKSVPAAQVVAITGRVADVCQEARIALATVAGSDLGGAPSGAPMARLRGAIGESAEVLAGAAGEARRASAGDPRLPLAERAVASLQSHRSGLVRLEAEVAAASGEASFSRWFAAFRAADVGCGSASALSP